MARRRHISNGQPISIRSERPTWRKTIPTRDACQSVRCRCSRIRCRRRSSRSRVCWCCCTSATWSFRQIYVDGRPLPTDPNPSWYGYSSAKWDGDTLVVETIGLRDGLWADFWGSPLTDRARITERFRRPNYGTLEVRVTVDDPKAYTRPWTVSVNQHIAIDSDLLEYACLENEKDVPRLVGK
jgi:hypothetical protein